ncbi:hypothetical protein LEN26_008154 [Aphanomyces euteiches]|nr:hypothetical protein AeMF1_016382 [Aphanomyces euteiches]KAH9130825.1 hypothetical protein LEN26_008154 [Aphanomyces euteiches]KAH9190546.1 hypothetical protein AeNC1_007474 [Aphanomyces euteiches]
MSQQRCMFTECPHFAIEGSTKCMMHRNRTKCEEPNCPNQAYARGRCVRHGAKKNCAISKCQYNRRFGRYCSKHADETQKKRCDVQGCEKQPHARGRCVRHGGGRHCQAEGCRRHARVGVFCTKHVSNETNQVPVGAPQTKPDWLDWAILKELILEYKEEASAAAGATESELVVPPVDHQAALNTVCVWI